MKVSSLINNVITAPGLKLARLSRPHGYRFEGDQVHLNAKLGILDPAAHERSWALQLWACPAVPASVQELTGQVVAEVALPPIGELADETEQFEVSANARPPAGRAEFVMVLVLASGRPGEFQDVHDFDVYPQRERFILPVLKGNVGYSIKDGRVQLSVERVSNPRAATNRSGTLSLELWAVNQPYAGGQFQGHHLAGVEIGSLNGESEMALQPIDLAFIAPPPGRWHIVLMLREWSFNGYVTRDFTSFETSFVSEPVAVVSAPAPAPAVAKKEIPEPLKPAKAVQPKSPELAAKVTAQDPVAPDARISVNTARVEELVSVAGLTRKQAEGIVRKRPFASLEDLRKVKGLGVKILAKVRSRLKL